MLATLTAELPQGGEWLYEVKLDGYRAIAYVRGGECTLKSRNGNDLTSRFVSVAAAVAAPSRRRTPSSTARSARSTTTGRPSFSAMQRGTGRLVYYAFDLLEADGAPLIALPIEERRARLAALLDRRGARRPLLGELRRRRRPARAAQQQGSRA